jgi:hypothetical protein
MKAIRTEAGEMYVLQRDASNELSRKRIGLGFLTLEPRALLLPQYSDASCLSIVHKGNMAELLCYEALKIENFNQSM